MIRRQSLRRSPTCRRHISVGEGRGERGTHLSFRVGARERHQDALLVSSLTSVGGKDFDFGVADELAGDELDLLAVESYDADVALRNTAGDESLRSLYSIVRTVRAKPGTQNAPEERAALRLRSR